MNLTIYITYWNSFNHHLREKQKLPCNGCKVKKTTPSIRKVTRTSPLTERRIRFTNIGLAVCIVSHHLDTTLAFFASRRLVSHMEVPFPVAGEADALDAELSAFNGPLLVTDLSRRSWRDSYRLSGLSESFQLHLILTVEISSESAFRD